MKRIYLSSIAIVLSILNTTRADTWAMPAESDYYSDNILFVAHVTPSQNQAKAKLEIFRIADSQKYTMWACTWGNEDAPEKVFITNDGNYAVTINEWGRKRHGRWGDYVVAFYNKNGLIKNYSLEQILHYPDKISKDRFGELCKRTSSGRIWFARPFFLDLSGNTLYFCVWLRYGKQWIAWDISTGNEIEITHELQTCLERKASKLRP